VEEENDGRITRGQTRTTSLAMSNGEVMTSGKDELPRLGDLHAAVVVEVEEVLGGVAVGDDPPVVRLVPPAEVRLELLDTRVEVD
jgi:hypothetical protein